MTSLRAAFWIGLCAVGWLACDRADDATATTSAPATASSASPSPAPALSAALLSKVSKVSDMVLRDASLFVCAADETTSTLRRVSARESASVELLAEVPGRCGSIQLFGDHVYGRSTLMRSQERSELLWRAPLGGGALERLHEIPERFFTTLSTLEAFAVDDDALYTLTAEHSWEANGGTSLRRQTVARQDRATRGWTQLARFDSAGSAPLVLTAEHVYWLQSSHEAFVHPPPEDAGSQGSSLWRVPKKGGAVERFVADLEAPQRLVVAEGALWIATGRGILRIPERGGAPERLTGPPQGVAWGGHAVYYMAVDRSALRWVDGEAVVEKRPGEPQRVLGQLPSAVTAWTVLTLTATALFAADEHGIYRVTLPR